MFTTPIVDVEIGFEKTMYLFDDCESQKLNVCVTVSSSEDDVVVGFPFTFIFTVEEKGMFHQQQMCLFQ